MTDRTHAQRERRLRARRKGLAKTRLGEDAALRMAGRPPSGDDSTQVMDQPLSVLSEWYVYQLDQLPPQQDPGQAREYAALRACVKTWGEMFAQQEALALLRR
jgi:hypothetical protein